MMKDINLTWKADGIIDSYTIYRAENESLDVNNLPPPLIAGVTVKGYTDNYVGDATSIHYRIASVKGDRSKISGEYIVEIGENVIPTNEMHFTTLAGTVEYLGVAGDQIIFSDGTSITLVEEYLYDIAAPAGKHKVVLKEPREATYVGIGGEALVELHNFPTLSSVNTVNTRPNNPSPNLVKVPTTLPSNITHIQYMFSGATSFNQDISMWDTSNVTDMYYMFNGAIAFNQPLNSWIVSNVTDMSNMFENAIAFNQDISGWDVSNVTNLARMFINATAFDQDIGGWDVSKVTNMNAMFNGAISFNQPLNSWNVSNVTDMYNMFENAIAFNQDLSQWCVSNITEHPSAFDLGATNWTLPKPVWGTCPRGENILP